MRPYSSLTGGALWVLLAGTLGAQQTAVAAQILTPPGPTAVCDVQLTGVVSTLPECAPQQDVRGGKASAVGVADLEDLTVSADVAMLQSGNKGLIAYAEAGGLITEKIDILGPSDPTDYLVLHFQADASWNFRGAGDDVFNTVILASRGEGEDHPSFLAGVGTGDGPIVHDGHGGYITNAGADLILPFGDFTGAYRYTYGVDVSMTVNSNAQRTGGHLFLDVALEGIDAYTSDGSYLGSVDFRQNGREILDLRAGPDPVTTPEPASFSLLAMGLIGVGSCTRSMRRRQRSA